MAVAAGSGVARAAAPRPPSLAVTLSPAAPDAQGHVAWIDVTVRVAGEEVAAGQPLLRMPLVMTNVVTTAKQLEGLRVTDSAGSVPFTIRDDPDTGQTFYRHWMATRPVAGELVVRYRAPITNALPARGAAPPLDLRTDDGGFGGAASDFLALPAGETPVRFRLSWDFRAYGKGAVGVSSFGPGDVSPAEPISPERLQALYVMGGAIGLYPDPPPTRGFLSAWEGHPPFDARLLMAWTKSLHDDYDGFFHVGGGKPYAVFLRRNLVNAGGGVELDNAFIGSWGERNDVSEFKLTLAHEMLHTFVGGLDAPKGLQSSWFSEGMAVFYARRLALRFDHIGPDQFLKDLNATAARYYTDALNRTPNADIPQRFWADTRIRVLPYDRGSMYFAVVDSEVRKASDGKKSLDDLLLSMLARRREGRPMDQTAWVETVSEAIGPRGKAEFEAMLAGALQVPPSGEFGPCFRRTTALLRRYQLGFEPAVLTETPRIVRGLIPGSAAQKAGLRNGDEILKPVPQDSIQADQHATLTLDVRRGGRDFQVTYLPRGETVQAYQWERVPGVPSSACAR